MLALISWSSCLGTPMYKLVIFDFDGTLADTVKDVAICFNESLKQCDFPQHSLQEICDLVGGNLEVIVSKLLPREQASPENIDRVKKLYRKIYSTCSKKNTFLYPGIMDLLLQLKEMKIRLAVNSNKGQELLEQMVEEMFPKGFFDAVIGYSENYPPKPDPYGVEMILTKCSCSAADAVYVGDGLSDIKTAQNAGLTCIFVPWGQGRLDTQFSESVWVAQNVSVLQDFLLF